MTRRTGLAGRDSLAADVGTRSTGRLVAWKGRSRNVRSRQDDAGMSSWSSERHDWLVPLELP